MKNDLEDLLITTLGAISSSPHPIGLCISHQEGLYRVDLVMLDNVDELARGNGPTIWLALTAMLYGMYRRGQRLRARR